MSHFRFAALIVSVFVSAGATIIFLGLTSEPYVGDLTRLGGYQESAFGWREPQQRFVPPRYFAERFEPSSDMLVLGDSMTLRRDAEQTDPGAFWTNWLAVKTGWTISALHRRDFTVEDVMALPAYRQSPPRLFVLEFAERAISGLERVTQVALQAQGGCEGQRPGSLPVLAVQPPSPQPMPEPLALAQPARKPLDLSLGGHRLKHWLTRQVWPGRLGAVAFPMTRADLFSNRQSDTLLVYRDDLIKVGLSDVQLRQQACGLRALQRSVEADGRTRFVVLIVPDKLSAYRPYVEGFPTRYPAVVPILAEQPLLGLPRVDLAFDEALRAGARDLFMPNDTHLGALGHRLLAEALLSDLEARGFARVQP